MEHVVSTDESDEPSEKPNINEISPSYEVVDGTTIPLAQNDATTTEPSYSTQTIDNPIADDRGGPVVLDILPSVTSSQEPIVASTTESTPPIDTTITPSIDEPQEKPPAEPTNESEQEQTPEPATTSQVELEEQIVLATEAPSVTESLAGTETTTAESATESAEESDEDQGEEEETSTEKPSIFSTESIIDSFFSSFTKTSEATVSGEEKVQEELKLEEATTETPVLETDVKIEEPPPSGGADEKPESEIDPKPEEPKIEAISAPEELIVVPQVDSVEQEKLENIESNVTEANVPLEIESTSEIPVVDSTEASVLETLVAEPPQIIPPPEEPTNKDVIEEIDLKSFNNNEVSTESSVPAKISVPEHVLPNLFDPYPAAQIDFVAEKASNMNEFLIDGNALHVQEEVPKEEGECFKMLNL